MNMNEGKNEWAMPSSTLLGFFFFFSIFLSESNGCFSLGSFIARGYFFWVLEFLEIFELLDAFFVLVRLVRPFCNIFYWKTYPDSS